MLAVQSQMNYNTNTETEKIAPYTHQEFTHQDSEITPTTTCFTLPDLISDCPFPTAYHPSGDAISAESALWLDNACPQLNEKRRKAVYGLKSGILAGYCYTSPQISDYRLRIVADYLNYLFHLDNISDGMLNRETEHLSEAVMNALYFPEDEPEDEINAARVARDLWRRCIRDGRAGPGFQARFKKTLQLYFDSTLTQARARDAGYTPDLESYIEFRRDNSGCKTTWAFMEYALGIDLPDCVVEDPHMQALDELTNDIVTWSNDIWSYDVEQSRDDAEYNMLTILMKYHGHTLQSASNHVSDLCHQATKSFVETSKNLPSWGPEIDDMVRRYIKGLEDWIIGSVHWSFETQRYFGNKGLEVKRTRVVALAPVSEKHKW